ncbi:MAG: M1 family metallopeptidase [Methanobacteriota archaeon]|nr:MAG: M1 family metallopeptidase [Euryarchaeota archaeon]
MPKGTTHRLPATVEPERYTIELRPDLSRFTFRGEESVAIRVIEPVKSIVLNASELEVTQAGLQAHDGRLVPAAKIEHLKDTERLRLTFGTSVPKGAATLRLVFTGILNDELSGFYRSRYTMANGTEGYMAATQFESTDARRAFPCWDEPAAKATFQLSLVVPDGMAAVSNTPIAEEKDLGDGTRLVRFAETPRMAPYLLAFVVGPLEAIKGRTRTGTHVGVWTLPDRTAHGRWALDESIRVLEYLNEYYGLPYPLEKLDHLALQDFAAGAMENWGAITYRERILLFDPATSSAQTRQNIVDVIAHETAHMWFGDLVTMAWWDDLWLNESFASWMGVKTVNALHPDWKMWTQFFGLDTIRGLVLDGLRSSHPIEVPVKDPAEIREIFDEISYSKGASILRMLEQFLGEASFRRGLQNYLKQHSYGNARTEDLWRALGAASGQPVRALMGTWTRQTGFPLLDVKVTRKNRDARISLSQSRFVYGHILRPTKEKTRWKIPVRIARAGGAKPTSFLMEQATASRSLGRSRRTPDRDWIKVNAGQSGFYRVNYSQDEWGRLRRAVASRELDAPDRIGLQNDAYAMTRAGYLPATTFLEFTSAYREEDDATAWRIIADSLQDFETWIADERYLDRLDAYGRDLFRAAGAQSGWDPRTGEGHLDTLKRTTVLGRLGHYAERPVLDEASRRFARSLQDPASLHPDLRGLVYGLVAEEADEATYETLWDLERKAALQEEQVRLLVALTRPRDKQLLQETLRRSLTDAVRSQDAVIVITNVATARPSLGRDLAWSFVKKNWDELYRRYAPSGFLIRRLVEIAQAFSTPEAAKDVESFFRAREAPEVHRVAQQAAEKIRVNAAWRNRNGKELARWFASRND